MTAEQICREAAKVVVKAMFAEIATFFDGPSQVVIASEKEIALLQPIILRACAQIIAESGAREALTLAKGDIQFWIEHNRDGENPMGEIGRSMLKTRAVLDAALANLPWKAQ